jgi:epoxyqueuosine reductase
MSAAKLWDDVRDRLQADGAALVACGDLRGLPEEARSGLPLGVSIAMAIDPAIVPGIVDGPTRAYEAEYHRLNASLDRLAAQAAAMLHDAGHKAEARAASGPIVDWRQLATPLPHKTVATRAGLGWVGRCAVLVTREFGSAVRLASVLTDAPLPASAPIDASECGECTACQDVCPADAPTGQLWQAGLAREELVDIFACLKTITAWAAQRGIGKKTICGMCIAACPWTQRYLGQHGTDVV